MGAADDNVDYQTLPDFYDSEADDEVSHSCPRLPRDGTEGGHGGAAAFRCQLAQLAEWGCKLYARGGKPSLKLRRASCAEQDEEWVRKQREGRSTDAILSCPACMETVSIECQRCVRRRLSQFATAAEP